LILEVKFQKNNRINNIYLNKIINLKIKEWKFNYKSQVNWLKENVLPNDLHVTLEYKKKLIGYTMLRERFLNINKRSKKKFYLFDTHVINKTFRGKQKDGFHPSRILMKKIQIFIIKKKKISFLLCNKNLIKYYKFFGWKIINKKKIKVKNEKNLTIMFYGKIDKNKSYNINI
jgi:hypothetical protein